MSRSNPRCPVVIHQPRIFRGGYKIVSLQENYHSFSLVEVLLALDAWHYCWNALMLSIHHYSFHRNTSAGLSLNFFVVETSVVVTIAFHTIEKSDSFFKVGEKKHFSVTTLSFQDLLLFAR
jgi:hypothetical protein